MSKEKLLLLNISDEYLKELLDYISRSLVGKILKRFEILDNKDAIKKASRELVYEELRNLHKLIEAHTKGLNISQFKFKKPKPENLTNNQ